VRDGIARGSALAAVAACLLACGMGGCAAMPDQRRETFGIDFHVAAPPEPPAVVVFFVDGVSPPVFEAMLEEERLPNLKRYFVDRGLYVRRCVANVPSVTLANETSFVTGVFPGRHGVTGINWFDRNGLLWRNYETIDQKNALDGDYRSTTVYECLGDATTFSLFFQAHRGATKFVENWMSAGPPYFFGWYPFVDRISLWRFDVVAEVARERGEFPALVIAYLLAPDMEAYRSGVSSESYEAALEHTDAHIGRIVRDLESAGLLDRLVLVFVSDHGMVDVERHWALEDWLRDEVGLSVARRHLWEETKFEKRLAYYRDFSCVYYGSGERYGALCLRKPRAGAGEGDVAFENWLVRPGPEDLRSYPARDGSRVDLVRRLREAEAADLVAYRAGPGLVHLVTKRGTVELLRPSAGSRDVAYRVLQGDDPLGYGDTVPTSMLYGKAFDAQSWLEATADTQYPDLVPQIMAYFDAPRAGDLVVFAAHGWDFGGHLRAGHGGVAPGEMFVPLIIAGPGVPRETHAGPVRAVDVMPTILDLLGRPVPEGLDGRCLRRRVGSGAE